MRQNNAIQGTGHDPFLRWTTYTACALLLLQWIAYNLVDIDLWHEMALIRESLALGHLLRTDPYAYTPALPWIDHEWGAGAIAYFATHWLGGPAILALKYLCALGTLLVCIRCSELRGADFRTIGVCAPLAIFLASWGFLPAVRAQDYSFLFTAIWLLFLEYDRRRSQAWIPAALVIFALWVNLHAGFVAIIGLTAIHAAENLLRREPYRHFLLLLLAMVLEIFINPYGATYFLYLKRALFMPRPYSHEWDNLSHLGPVWVTAFAAALLTAIAGAWSAGWRKASGLGCLAATAVIGAAHRKLLPLFAITWLCYVPSYLQNTRVAEWWARFADRRRRFLISAWGFLACVCAYAACRDQFWKLHVPQPLYPVGAVEYLSQTKFKGNLMTPFRIGAYVSWKTYPEVKVSLDSRYEVAYPDAVVKRVFDFYNAMPGWQLTLAAWPTDAVLIPRDAPVEQVMPAGWPRVYIDDQFEVYEKPGTVMSVVDKRGSTFEGTFP